MERTTTGAGEPPHKTQKGAVCQIPPQGMYTSSQSNLFLMVV